MWRGGNSVGQLGLLNAWYLLSSSKKKEGGFIKGDKRSETRWRVVSSVVGADSFTLGYEFDFKLDEEGAEDSALN